MALLKCPGCGNDVSDYSRECPKCGTSIEFKVNRKSNINKELTSLLISIIMAAVITIAAGIVYFITTEINFYFEIAVMVNFTVLIYTVRFLIKWLKTNKK